jgi:hypothetical protein
MSGTRTSGQSNLMEKTFAGANKCSARKHERPFVIEWDATDMSSFESLAGGDIVFVKYEGCDLTVMDSCKDDSVKGSLGAYKAIDWTSGSVEKIDIANEAELFAKLPLGVASLGGRVEAGEQFHMEYFVSGTRTATRAAVYAPDLSKNPGCRGVTHFVYAYNLGAFALGSQKHLKGEAGATVWGIGAGASSKSVSSAEKKGGVLTACRGDSAKETDTCKVPIRLTLRAIEGAENPDLAAQQAPETPTARSLAGKLDAKIKQGEQAEARWNAAKERMLAGDGKACLKELDARDRLDPKTSNLSTNPSSHFAYFRARCVMLSGQCEAGKAQLRKALQATWGNKASPEMVDQATDTEVRQSCQGASMTPRDQLIRAASDLGTGAMSTTDAATCSKAWATVKRLAPQVKARDDQDWAVTSAASPSIQARSAASCLGRAGDCPGAWQAYKEAMSAEGNTQMEEAIVRGNFKRQVSQCKDWMATLATSPRDELVGAVDELMRGTATKVEPSECTRAYETVKRLAKSVPPRDANDYQIAQARSGVPATFAASCLGKAGDCEGAWRAYSEYARGDAGLSQLDAATLRQYFAGQVPTCRK